MALNANNSKNKGSGGSGIEPLEPGAYPGRLVMVVDLGLQAQRPFQGQEKPPAYEVLTVYELADEFVKDEDGNEDREKPRWVSESFPLYSLDSEKSKSTKRYLAIDGQREHNGNWPDLLGSPVLVTIVNNPGKGVNAGKTFMNVGSTSPMRAKDAARLPDLVNKPLFFDIDSPDIDVFNQLPQWVQKRIQSGLEYPGSQLEKLVKANPVKEAEPTKKAKKIVEAEDTDEDENPY